MKLNNVLASSVLVAFTVPLCVVAQPTLRVFDDKVTFLQATAATSLTGPLPNIGRVPNGYRVGAVTFSTVPPAGNLYVGQPSYDWTPLLPGAEIAISGAEYLDAQFDQPMLAAGFDFVDKTTSDPGCPGMDSTFSVTLINGSTNVGSFNFNALNDVAAFVGVQSRVPFQKLEIRELVNACEDDFFGQFYGGQMPLVTILLKITRVTNTVSVSWYAETGLRYQAQSASALTGTSWVDLGTAIDGAGADVSFTETVGSQPRFYRVYATKP